jgi:hypothetical protein
MHVPNLSPKKICKINSGGIFGGRALELMFSTNPAKPTQNAQVKFKSP